jgi:hypothetical protein
MKKKKPAPKKGIKKKSKKKSTKKSKPVWSKPFEFSEDDFMNSGRTLFPYDHEDV